MEFILLSNFTAFLGRFHPLMVHLPIGFLLLALILSWLNGRQDSEKGRSLIAYAWLLGALSALAAAMCGWVSGQ